MKRASTGSYAVGFGKPPRSTQFQKGQSGNPKGRPKGSLNLATVLQRALAERVTVVEHGRQKTITKLEAAAKQLANKAASGDVKALNMLLPQLALIDAAFAVSSETASLDADDQAVLKRFMGRLAAPPLSTPSEAAKAGERVHGDATTEGDDE